MEKERELDELCSNCLDETSDWQKTPECDDDEDGDFVEATAYRGYSGHRRIDDL